VSAELESRELLALCLKRLKLTKVRLVDAGFIWTEPHSRRIKVKVVIQKEVCTPQPHPAATRAVWICRYDAPPRPAPQVFANTILQQEFIVEYIVANQNCDDCHRTAAKDHWNAVVQVRQKVDHKKTFFFLEQLIIKHRAAAKTVNIKEAADGLDFFYAAKNDALKMVEFFQNVAPVRVKASERLISTDIQNNTANFKFTFSVEVLPICKDDLVCLPAKLATRLGNISALCLVYRVGTGLYLIDPQTLQTADISNDTYWRTPFPALCSYKQLTEYIVLNIDPLGPTRGKACAMASPPPPEPLSPCPPVCAVRAGGRRGCAGGGLWAQRRDVCDADAPWGVPAAGRLVHGIRPHAPQRQQRPL
jgi:nonsense-mediated mRNA decay protein 3